MLPNERQLPAVEGWSFEPTIMAFKDQMIKNVPEYNLNRFVVELKASHGWVDMNAPIYGIDVDSILITLVGSGEQFVMRPAHSFLFAYDKLFLNSFRFVDTTSGVILIPPEIDTVRLEYDVCFYKGRHTKYFEDEEDMLYDMKHDSIAVDTVNPDTFRRHVVFDVVRKESRGLGPCF